jgi:type III secretory pathway component EscV
MISSIYAMAISRKPSNKVGTKQEIDIDALINKGGGVAQNDEDASSEKVIPVTVRIPSDLMTRIQQAIKARAIKTPRHTWILEALLEKLEREEKSN